MMMAEGRSSGRGKFASLLMLFQGLLLVLYVVFVEYNEGLLPTTESERNERDGSVSSRRIQDLYLFTFVGFGLLSSFLRKYCFSGIGYCFLICGLVIEWSTLVQGFYHMREGKILFSQESLIQADYAVVAILISFGAVLGKTSNLQLLVLAVMETIFFSANHFIASSLLKAADIGGSMFIHVFGACYGLVIARVLYNCKIIGHDRETSSYTSDILASIGTLFLWIYWPSYVGVRATGRELDRVTVNTYYTLAAACVSSFAMSALITNHSKISMVHIQNSTLAGGVAVGSIANLVLQPWGGLLLGLAAGVLSTAGYKYLQPWLITRLKIHDSCGVCSLHGLPGLLAALASCIAAASSTYGKYKTSLYHIYPARAPRFNTTQFNELIEFSPEVAPGLGRSASQQAAFQFAALAATIAIAVLGGVITGFLMKMDFFGPIDEDDVFNDEVFWEMPLDFNLSSPFKTSSVMNGRLRQSTNNSEEDEGTGV